MKSIAVKFAAVCLAALCLLTAICSGLGMIYLSEYDLYGQGEEQSRKDYLQAVTWDMAYDQAEKYLATVYGDLQETEAFLLETPSIPWAVQNLVVSVEQPVMVSEHEKSTVEERNGMIAVCHIIHDVCYPQIWAEDETVSGTPMGEPMHLQTRFVQRGSKTVKYNMQYYRWDMEPLLVTVLLRVESNPWQELAGVVYDLQDYLPALLAGNMLLLAVCVVYLCWAAGRRPRAEEIRPGGLNRLPLDLYAAADCFLGYWGLMILFEAVPTMAHSSFSWLAMVAAFGTGLGLCLLIVGYVFAFAAQIKVKGFWWRRSVIGWCCIRVFRALRFCLRGIRAVFRLLPVMWQWLLTACGMALAALVCCLGAMSSYYPRNQYYSIALFFVMLACGGIVLYGGYCFGTIRRGAREMAKGNLDHKVPVKYLFGPFRECGENLNSLSAAAMAAARQQMKSERMKTELITNVSHDIKTPLTSIINYVDLLLKPHTPEQGDQYLQVLARQSQRLKKLTEDLVELSKATTGNISVELTTLDAAETVLQALGEFGDKLEAVPLSVVFRQPEQPIHLQADGRLTWRVISNLLSNAVKYAQSGTRLYVDIVENGETIGISFKNISRESLNISAEELMGRFVRGDSARNTEGSGLGLSIAAGLMQAQRGSLELTVDGDLFKVLLIFPRA